MARGGFWAVALAITIIVSGCLEGAPTPDQREAKVRAPGGAQSPGLPANEFGERVQIYGKDGLTPLELPEFPAPIDVSIQPIKPAGNEQGVRCGEPTGGVTWKKAYIYQVCLANVFRSSDHGATWEQVSTQVSSPTTLDPYMWVDPFTDRVYSIQLYVGCSYLAYSDDYGATWIPNPLACGVPVNDHQTMAGGPPAAPMVGTPAYRNFLHYCVNQFGVDTACSRSFDGGLTWTGGPAQITRFDVETGGSCTAINGHVVVSKDGTVYLPKRTCNRPSVMVSLNNGLTWEEKVVSRAHAVIQSLAHDPSIATDTAGNAYYFWTGDDGIMRLSHSQNKGAAWSAPVRVTPGTMTYSLFETSVAGDPGRVAVAYYGTSMPRDTRWKYASQAPNETVWNLFLTWSENALDENPIFTTVQINPADDPIQRGCVWLQGGGGGPNMCRNLLDFFDASMGADGRVYVHYADGCVDKCITWTPESKERVPRTSYGVVGVVQSGPSLFEQQDWLEPLPVGTKIT